MEFKHIPIMLNECLEGLNIKPSGTYVDCTIGGAGHSSQILKFLKKGTLIGIDKDKEAIETSRKRLSEISNNFILANDDFKNYKQIIGNLGIKNVDGILIDLGVSSYQIDNAERGFSYIKDAKLDMRMNSEQALSAYEVVNEYEPAKLVKILFEYGEESFAKQIVSKIVEARKIAPINTTLELSNIIASAIPAKFRFKNGNPAKKTFQAIRIEVNAELTRLDTAIKDMVESLNKGGRLAIITFHSLEDRIVKNAFKELATDCICPPEFPVCVCNHKASIKLVNKKPLIPTSEETLENSRSTSAKLRVAEKI
ncbi:MAG: 16S rRNA (cytosine(1402)-N(4))-methyltransferase RsmH [Spirochaetales bacterium]